MRTLLEIKFDLLAWPQWSRQMVGPCRSTPWGHGSPLADGGEPWSLGHLDDPGHCLDLASPLRQVSLNQERTCAKLDLGQWEQKKNFR